MPGAVGCRRQLLGVAQRSGAFEMRVQTATVADVSAMNTSATCGRLDSHLERTGPLRDAQQLAAAAYGSGTRSSSPTAFDGQQGGHPIIGGPGDWCAA